MDVQTKAVGACTVMVGLHVVSMEKQGQGISASVSVSVRISASASGSVILRADCSSSSFFWCFGFILRRPKDILLTECVF